MTRRGMEWEASRMRRRVPCREAGEAHAIETSGHPWPPSQPQCRGIRDCLQPAGVVGAEDRKQSEA